MDAALMCCPSFKVSALRRPVRPHQSDDSQLTPLQYIRSTSPAPRPQDERPSAHSTYPPALPMVPPPPSAESTRSFFEVDQDPPQSSWLQYIGDRYFPARSKCGTGNHSGQTWKIRLPQSPMEAPTLTLHTSPNTTPCSSRDNRSLIPTPVVSTPVQDDTISTTTTQSLHPSRSTTSLSVISKAIQDDSSVHTSTRCNQPMSPVSIVSTAIQVQGDTSLTDGPQEDSSKPDASGSHWQQEEIDAILRMPYIFTRIVRLSNRQVLSYAYFVSESIEVGRSLFIEGRIEAQVVTVLSQMGSEVYLCGPIFQNERNRDREA
ncbi:hypothetical protein VNI00_008922 [Paramarasmius palmivorus]|uniref:Uncharacterized protein n=1 Tax=Paramarasmius palmivorus TaxID=297713 RepID=A0AAW0CRN0_9AGAR